MEGKAHFLMPALKYHIPVASLLVASRRFDLFSLSFELIAGYWGELNGSHIPEYGNESGNLLLSALYFPSLVHSHDCNNSCTFSKFQSFFSHFIFRRFRERK
jgi:hypothetical protein